NSVFFLTSDQARLFPSETIMPALVSLREFEGIELDIEAHARLGTDKTKRWLLAIPHDQPVDGPLGAYLEQHRRGVESRYLARQRKPWYSITELPRPDIVLSPLTKTNFKVVVNRASAVPSNNLYGISLRNGGDPRMLADWLRSDDGQAELKRLSRRYP